MYSFMKLARLVEEQQLRPSFDYLRGLNLKHTLLRRLNCIHKYLFCNKIMLFQFCSIQAVCSILFLYNIIEHAIQKRSNFRHLSTKLDGFQQTVILPNGSFDQMVLGESALSTKWQLDKVSRIQYSQPFLQ